MRGKTTVFMFILLLFAAVGILACGNDGQNGENRAQSAPPPFTRESVLSGGFASGMEAYINDRVGFRNELIGAAHKIKSRMGIKSPAGIIIRADMDLGTEEKQSSDILIENGKICELFRMNGALADRYASAVNAYADKLKDSGAEIFSAVVPTQLEFEKPIYSNLEDSQKDAVDYIYGLLNKDIKRVDIHSTMKNHIGEYIYFRTDHHWTMLGAYYGYKAFCKAAGIKAVDIDDYEKHAGPEFYGYLSAFAAGADYEKKPDTLEWYDTEKKGGVTYFMRSYNDKGEPHEYKTPVFYKEKDNYDFFLGADHALAVYKNKNAREDKSLLVISDSFVNAMAPWLIESYKTVALINPRSYKKTLADAVKEFKPDHVLVLNYTFAVTFEDYCTVMENLE